MAFIFVRVIWDAHPVKFPLRLHQVRINELHVSPETAYPFGRKGLVLESGWKQLSDPDSQGLLILDGDVMIDPQDFENMRCAIEADPDCVWVAPARIWPVSTGKPRWTWGHWKDQPSTEWCDNPEWFAFNFTYLPAALMTAAIKDSLRLWQFPKVDMNMSRTARKQGIKVRVVPDCAPKHMHY
jgi:hypothetical protein